MDPGTNSRIDLQVVPMDRSKETCEPIADEAIESAIRHLWVQVQDHLHRDSDLRWKSPGYVEELLAPYLYKLNLLDYGTEVLRARGEEAYWENSLRYLRLLGGLKGLVFKLAGEGIQVVLLKGMALVETLYGEPGFRTVGDIDMLVRVADFNRSVAVLEGLGWMQVGAEHEFNRAAIEEDAPWALGEIKFRDEKGRSLDLHSHLVPYSWLRMLYHLEMSEIWEQVEPYPGGTFEGAWILSPAHELIYACLHLAQHGLFSLTNLLDIDLLVRKFSQGERWDWEKVQRLSQKWDIQSTLFHSLGFGKAIFGTPVSEGVLGGFDPGIAAKSRIRLLIQPNDLLFADGYRMGTRYPVLVKAALVDRVEDLAKMGLRLIFPDEAWCRWRYGGDSSLTRHWRHVWKVLWQGG